MDSVDSLNIQQLQEDQNNVWYEYNSSTTVIVFVHGFLSNSKECWYYKDKNDPSKNQFWPDLVRDDKRFHSPSLFLGGFYTEPDAGEYGLSQCAAELFDALKQTDEHDHKPVMARSAIVFVCHSTGGIVIRDMLDRHREHFKAKQVGLVLIASPSYGSALADRLTFITHFYYNKLGRQLEWGNWNLQDLDGRFKDLIKEHKIPGLQGVEASENHFILHRTWLPDRLYVVPAESAGRYFGSLKILRNTDHFSSCKAQRFAPSRSRASCGLLERDV